MERAFWGLMLGGEGVEPLELPLTGVFALERVGRVWSLSSTSTLHLFLVAADGMGNQQF